MRQILLPLAIVGFSSPVLGGQLGLRSNQAIEFVPVAQQIAQVAVHEDPGRSVYPEDSIECWSQWTADGGGPIWYTPERYVFAAGDTLETVILAALSCQNQLAHDFLRIDAFYICGQSNPLSYVLTSGIINFGEIPPNEPGYAYITGIAYLVPHTSGLSIDWGSRLLWGDAINHCGFPLMGRPDCFQLLP